MRMAVRCNVGSMHPTRARTRTIGHDVLARLLKSARRKRPWCQRWRRLRRCAQPSLGRLCVRVHVSPTRLRRHQALPQRPRASPAELTAALEGPAPVRKSHFLYSSRPPPPRVPRCGRSVAAVPTSGPAGPGLASIAGWGCFNTSDDTYMPLWVGRCCRGGWRTGWSKDVGGRSGPLSQLD